MLNGSQYLQRRYLLDVLASISLTATLGGMHLKTVHTFPKFRARLLAIRDEWQYEDDNNNDNDGDDDYDPHRDVPVVLQPDKDGGGGLLSPLLGGDVPQDVQEVVIIDTNTSARVDRQEPFSHHDNLFSMLVLTC